MPISLNMGYAVTIVSSVSTFLSNINLDNEWNSTIMQMEYLKLNATIMHMTLNTIECHMRQFP